MKRIFSVLFVVSLCIGQAFGGAEAETKPGAAPVAKPSATVVGNEKEAPMLAALVKEGKLPPVEQRLPKNPPVIKVVEELGVYGGTVRTLTQETSYFGDGELMIPREPPLRIGKGGEVVEPNVIREWSFSPDTKVFTFKLVEGIRWSDGTILNAEDVMFWWNDIILNKEFTPTLPQWLKYKGVAANVTALDDYTVRMEYTGPVATIVNDMSFWNGIGAISYWNKEFLSQFHPKYTAKADLDKKVKDAGLDSWMRLLEASRWDQRGYFTKLNPTKIPTLQPWVMEKVELNTMTLVRNPYYWKVDEKGRQLPYIDRITVDRVEDTEIMDMKRIAGEADLGSAGFPLNKLSLLKDNEKKGNFRVLMYDPVYSTAVLYQFNLTYAEDKVLRDVFRDKRFRIAMSHALNRQEISDIIYQGVAVPIQSTISSVTGKMFYKEEFAKMYYEYKPDVANKLLDEMGLKKGPDGFRLRPDGKRLEILLEYYNTETPKRQITELAKKYWADIGVKVESKEITGTMVTQKAVGNTMQMGNWHGNRASSHNLVILPFWTVPTLGWEKTWAPLWAHWYATDGKSGEEPPEEIKQAIKAYENLRATTDKNEQIKYGQELLRIAAENVWTIGTVAGAPQPLMVNNKLRNVPVTGFIGWDVQQLDTYHPEQFFMKP